MKSRRPVYLRSRPRGVDDPDHQMVAATVSLVRWTRFMALGGAVTVLVGAVTICVLLWQLQASRAQLKADERPWLKADLALLDTTPADDGPYVEFSYTLNNTGHSPAVNVSVTGKIIIVGADDNDANNIPMIAAEDFCHSTTLDTVLSGRYLFGDIVFPGQEQNSTITARINYSELTDVIARSGSKDFNAAVLFCVNYNSPELNQNMQTSRIYALDVKGQDPWSVFPISKAQMQDANTAYYLKPYLYATGFAN